MNAVEEAKSVAVTVKGLVMTVVGGFLFGGGVIIVAFVMRKFFGIGFNG
jgi:hypothetical protein